MWWMRKPSLVRYLSPVKVVSLPGLVIIIPMLSIVIWYNQGCVRCAPVVHVHVSCRYSPSYADPQMTTGPLHWSICLSQPAVPGLMGGVVTAGAGGCAGCWSSCAGCGFGTGCCSCSCCCCCVDSGYSCGWLGWCCSIWWAPWVNAVVV